MPALLQRCSRLVSIYVDIFAKVGFEPPLVAVMPDRRHIGCSADVAAHIDQDITIALI
jgi:hypothetical protein